PCRRVGGAGGLAPVLLADAAQGAHLLGGKLAAGDPAPHQEERVLDLGVLRRPGLATADPRAALRVQAPPAEPAAQVLRVDGAKALVRVAGEDPLADVEPVVVFLESFGRVQRLKMAKRPLALATMGPGWHASFPSAAREAAPQAGTSGAGRG